MKPNDLKMERIKKEHREGKLTKHEALNQLGKELRKLPGFKQL